MLRSTLKLLVGAGAIGGSLTAFSRLKKDSSKELSEVSQHITNTLHQKYKQNPIEIKQYDQNEMIKQVCTLDGNKNLYCERLMSGYYEDFLKSAVDGKIPNMDFNKLADELAKEQLAAEKYLKLKNK